MSHNIEFNDYAFDCDKKKVQKSWDEYVRHADWQEGASGLPNSIEWKNMTPFEDYNAAYNWINKNDTNKWYWCVAVPYKDYEVSREMSQEDKKVYELKQKRDEYIKAHSVKTFKSALIGCKNCGSKLSRTHLRGEHCPLCNADLRGDTTIEYIMNFDKRIATAIDKAEEAKKKRAKNVKTRWLVKIEYHT